MRALMLAAALVGVLAADAGAQSYGVPTTLIRATEPVTVARRPVVRRVVARKPALRHKAVPSARRLVARPLAPGWCHVRAARLREFDWQVQEMGRVAEGEARIASALRADLRGVCGRWFADRTWYAR